MKSLSFLLLAASMAFSPLGESVLIHRFIVQPSSKLTIDGKTNVNSFQCATAKYIGKDTLVLIEGNRRKPFFESGYVGLDASSFDCGLPVMTHDFSKTIKAKEHPAIFIEFISFERIPVYTSQDKFKGKVKISLAGVTKTFQMDCTIEPHETGYIHLRGGRSFTFSDFDLEAPKRMMGLIKVDDELVVNFHLVLLLDRNS
jgi:hypothetical protein